MQHYEVHCANESGSRVRTERGDVRQGVCKVLMLIYLVISSCLGLGGSSAHLLSMRISSLESAGEIRTAEKRNASRKSYL